MLDMATKSTLVLLAAVFTAAFTVAVEKAAVPTPKHEVLRGRVMADVASLAFGVGLGPKWESFIFAVETSSKNAPPFSLKPDAVLPCYMLWYGQYRQVGPAARP